MCRDSCSDQEISVVDETRLTLMYDVNKQNHSAQPSLQLKISAKAPVSHDGDDQSSSTIVVNGANNQTSRRSYSNTKNLFKKRDRSQASNGANSSSTLQPVAITPRTELPRACEDFPLKTQEDVILQEHLCKAPAVVDKEDHETSTINTISTN